MDGAELRTINSVIDSILLSNRADHELYDVARTCSLKLPLRLREALTRLRLEMSSPYLVLRGFPVLDHLIGPTPTSKQASDSAKITREDVFLALTANQLGIPFSFATQQSGRLIQNVLPVKGSEYSQLGAGSVEELVWHTEDAFHPNRPDLILLMCLRNHDCVATTVGGLPNTLSEEEINHLFDENFIFLPDPDHAEHLKNWKTPAQEAAFASMQRYIDRPNPQAVLSGSRTKPYLRLDPKFTRVADQSRESAKAYQRLVAEMDRLLLDIPLEAGQILVIDNHKLVHGRRSFAPRYDGTDRWLRKINVTADLRKSMASRFSENEFVVA
jgi:L-asparagine oxygenase